MRKYKKLLITLVVIFSGCKETFVLTYKTNCSRGNAAYYFSNKEGVELSIVDTCNAYEYGKKVSKDWIIKQSNK